MSAQRLGDFGCSGIESATTNMRCRRRNLKYALVVDKNLGDNLMSLILLN